MSFYKFSIGDAVRIQIKNHPWLNDYEAMGTIADFGYFLNGVPTYVIETGHKEILRGVFEKRISLEKVNK